MGATTFYIEARGQTATEAFERAHADFCYEYGHGGYTGTIAEKTSFVRFEVPEGMTPKEVHETLSAYADLRDDGTLVFIGDYTPNQRKRLASVYDVHADKWGPALCMGVTSGVWAFCGWASE